MTVLVTRPGSDGTDFADMLRADGHVVLQEPVLRIEPRDVPRARIDAALQGVQGAVFTSINGVRTLASKSNWRGPAWCVGAATAEGAGALGFGPVHAGGGDVVSLAAHIAGQADPASGPLLHLAGKDRAGDLARLLGGSGHDVRRQVLYDAVPSTALRPETARALGRAHIDVATFFSPRSALIFADLVRGAGLADAMKGVRALCLSQPVADSLNALACATIVCEKPHRDSMRAHLHQLTR